MLDPAQAETIRKQLLSQIESSSMPNKEELKESISNMNAEELEDFLIENKLIKEGQSNQPGKCIFCSIIDKEIPSYILDENKEAIGVLEINPISKGHIIIIPKKHLSSSKELPQPAFSLAKKFAKKIKTNLKPNDTPLLFSNAFGHEIINVLPVYTNESLASPRKKASEEELLSLQKILSVKKKSEGIVTKVKKSREKLEIKGKSWLPKRIP
ncbi:MAG TPA: HIT domain-containing protein [Candidatus Nanoarchaeia archaeon]|nr:HIT domain-containing protein [Candidatus Nanoarchaeia archaeon]